VRFARFLPPASREAQSHRGNAEKKRENRVREERFEEKDESLFFPLLPLS
jgi:hypothetical protein